MTDEDRKETTEKVLGEAIRPDGSLLCDLPWFAWRLGDKQIQLDGDFTPEQLAAIAYHVKTREKFL
jgi:hypothetical protein